MDELGKMGGVKETRMSWVNWDERESNWVNCRNERKKLG